MMYKNEIILFGHHIPYEGNTDIGIWLVTETFDPKALKKEWDETNSFINFLQDKGLVAKADYHEIEGGYVSILHYEVDIELGYVYWRIWSRTSPRHKWTLVTECKESYDARKIITSEREKLAHLPKAQVAMDQMHYPNGNRTDVSLPKDYDGMYAIWSASKEHREIA